MEDVNKTLETTNNKDISSSFENTVSLENRKNNEKTNEAAPLTIDPTKESDFANVDDMSSSFSSKVRINTEEEAKAALAERRRLAREEAEKQAELERLRIEEEARLELERQQREEEQQRLLIEQQRAAEQERLEEVRIILLTRKQNTNSVCLISGNKGSQETRGGRKTETGRGTTSKTAERGTR